MKFLSLFTKTPEHQRFNYVPRYYDAKKEEMQEREARIRHELHLEEESEQAYRSRIAGSFHAARRRSKSSSGGLSATLLRFGILLFLVLFLMAYLTWGKVALYSLVLFVPIYIYAKFKRA